MQDSHGDRLIGWETHGFMTMEELDFKTIKEEANERWLRPTEIHAILCNYNNFTINVKPVNLPISGKIILFDREKVRNFRQDGHNWKKAKDNKSVKRSHTHLKVSGKEMVNVYYAYGEDNPKFSRRCYWLLDKTAKDIVLVHYRKTNE